jgi:hypothetical protein
MSNEPFVSPYLRRPLRTLEQCLREQNRRQGQNGEDAFSRPRDLPAARRPTTDPLGEVTGDRP